MGWEGIAGVSEPLENRAQQADFLWGQVVESRADGRFEGDEARRFGAWPDRSS